MKNRTALLLAAALALPAWGQDMSNSIELTQLYIVGDATSASWNLAGADEMHRIDEGVFEWTGRLEANKDFKFMNTREAWHKHIVAAEANTEAATGGDYPLNFYADWGLGGDKDCKFHVADGGTYTIVVDLNAMRMSLSEPVVTAAWPEHFYLTGTALGSEVVEIAARYGVEHKASVHLVPGKIKLMDTPVETAATHYYRPVFEEVDVTYGAGCHTPLFECYDKQAYGWNVGVEGDYNLYLDNAAHTYRFVRLKPATVLYLVGGCCERAWNYWDKSNCLFLPSDADPYKMVWEGELRIGWDKKKNSDGTESDPDEPAKFKILTAQDWFRDTYHPYVADAAAEGTSGARITGGDDLKWTISRNGFYRLELDIRTETLTGTLLEAEPEQAPAGASESAGVTDVTREPAGPCVYYDLQGRRVANPGCGVYVEVCGSAAGKVMHR